MKIFLFTKEKNQGHVHCILLCPFHAMLAMFWLIQFSQKLYGFLVFSVWDKIHTHKLFEKSSFLGLLLRWLKSEALELPEVPMV